MSRNLRPPPRRNPSPKRSSCRATSSIRCSCPRCSTRSSRAAALTIKDIQLGQRQADPSHARSRCVQPTAAQLDEILDAIHDHGAVPIDAAGLRRWNSPTWTAPFPRVFTAPPTTAPRFGSAANGSTSRIRRWTAASCSTSNEEAARCLADGARQEGRPDRRRPAGPARLARGVGARGRACSSSCRAPSPARSRRA